MAVHRVMYSMCVCAVFMAVHRVMYSTCVCAVFMAVHRVMYVRVFVLYSWLCIE